MDEFPYNSGIESTPRTACTNRTEAGIGVSASSNDIVGGTPLGFGLSVPALSIVLAPFDPNTNKYSEITACNSPADNPCFAWSGSNVFLVDEGGNIRITGQIYTSGSCSSGCDAGPHHASRRVLSYSETQTEPSIEDFGEAQLVEGAAYVRLREDFADVIDARANYLVFITPEGDNRGLYVTQKTHLGFEVRESQGGKSTLAFSYRIVAKRLGAPTTRLPMTSQLIFSGHRL